MDQQLFTLINHAWARPSLDLLMAIMSSFDFWLPFLILAGVLTLWLGGFRARTFVLCALFAVAVGDGIVSNSLKKAVNRPRPNQGESGVRVVTLRKARPQALAILKPPLIKASQAEKTPTPGRSFPSSHIMNNFSAAMTLALFYRRFGWLAFLPASLVAYSRVYVGSHWPSDAIASIFLGICVGALSVGFISWIWRKWGRRLIPKVHANHPTLLRITPHPATASFICLFLAGWGISRADDSQPAHGRAEHVVVMVWDGLRPDLVTEKNVPTLFRLTQQGVFFAQHHPVYPSSTEVNGTALATGAFPARGGIVGNKEFRPGIKPSKPVATERIEVVRKGDKISGGKYLGLPTVAELVQDAGFSTAVSGSKPVALLLDRSEARTSPAAQASVDVFQGETVPADALPRIVQQIGEFPAEITYPNSRQDAWTTRALTEVLWKDGVPKYSVLWMSDPDYSQHNSGPGSPPALDSLKRCDEQLAAMLASLDAKDVREKTDVFIVSDHGFSTISETVDVAQALTDAGFHAAREFVEPPKAGDILVVSLGGSVSLYVTGHDVEVSRRLVEFLQTAPFSGVIFARNAMEGTFSFETIHIDSPDAPDIVVSMRWAKGENAFGLPGTLLSDLGRKPGQGTHASLSLFDMHNSLIAAGPDFTKGMRDELPTGNVDVAPTILWILGITPAQPLDGRVLNESFQSSETLQGRNGDPEKTEEAVLESSRELPKVKWRQYLRVAKCGGKIYFVEGNGEQIQK